jgi:type I restriction enzyme S subunit
MKPTTTAIPKGWTFCPLGSLLREIDVRVMDLPRDQRKSIELLSLTKRFGLIPQSQRFEKRVATENVDKYKVVRPGWIVYNPYVIWEGAIHALRRDTPGIVSPVYVVWERTEDDGGFLDLILRTPELIAAYEKLSAGAVNRRRSIKKDGFRGIEVATPPLEEQRKIAGVLKMVKRTLDQQERLLALTGELKKSLVNQLFTKGLRGEPQQQTEIGPVPQSWEVVRLSDVCSFQSGGTPSKQRPDYWEGTIPWVSPKDMKRPRLTDVADHISQEALDEGSKLAPAWSVLVVVRGMILAKDIPVALTEVPMAINQDMKAIIPGERLFADFLLYAISAFKQKLFEKVGRSAHGTMTLMGSEVVNFLIPLPDKETQRQVADAIQTLERKCEIHQRKLDALTALFHTLLHQLMTAQIPVCNLDLPEMETALKE